MEWAGLLSILNGLAAMVVVLGLALFCHELGHFMAAKAFNCRVDDFALGFGPSLIAKQHGETTYRLNVIPFGGYVRIAGMEPGTEDVERGFYSIPRYSGAVILLAGVTMNVVLAIVMYSMVALWHGVADPADDSIVVAKVIRDSAAERGGLMVDDVFVRVNDSDRSLRLAAVTPGGPADKAGLRQGMFVQEIGEAQVYLPRTLYELAIKSSTERVRIAALDFTAETLGEQYKVLELPRPQGDKADAPRATELLEEAWGVKFGELDNNALVGAITHRPGHPLVFTVLRDGEEVDVKVTPDTEWERYPVRDASGNVAVPHAQVGRIGVVLRRPTVSVGPVAAVTIGALNSYGAVVMVIETLRLIITKQIQDAAGGPVAIMAMSAEQAKIGWYAVLQWVGFISANLAVMNLIPFPPFDGFRLALLGWEGMIRRRINAQADLALTLGGFISIVILLLIITSRDILNLIKYGTP